MQLTTERGRDYMLVAYSDFAYCPRSRRELDEADRIGFTSAAVVVRVGNFPLVEIGSDRTVENIEG